MKIKTTLTMLLLTISSLFAQSNLEDVVYLKNGSIIHGTIVEQVPNQSIKIKTKDGNILAYKIEEVEKMTKETPVKQEEPQDTLNIKYSAILEGDFGHSLKGAAFYESSFGGSIINGVSIYDHFNIGVGLGVERYLTYKYATFMPLYIDVKAYTKKVNGMFISFSVGTGLSLHKAEVNRGRYMNTAIGLKIGDVSKHALLISLGYKMQEYTGTNIHTGDFYEQAIQNVNFKLGFIF